MKEKNLQNRIVKFFSATFPEQRGLFFEINNTVLNIQHFQNRMNMGMISGVSDLIYINKHGVLGIEIKEEGNRYEVSHVMNQLTWGLNLIKQNHFFIMSSNEKEIQDVIKLHYKGIYQHNISKIQTFKRFQLLESIKTKTFQYTQDIF